MNQPPILIVPLAASKRREVDRYSSGCDPDTCRQTELATPAPAGSALEVMSALVGRKLQPDEVYTFDPNVYCDTKSPPGFRVVRDNTQAGRFRMEHDRLENSRGRLPTAEERAQFEKDELPLYHTTYELSFEIKVVALDEVTLAHFLGVTNHS